MVSRYYDVSISRPSHRVHWAVPVPASEDQSVYVWLDALVNYLTAVGYPESSLWPPNCQVLGKDILKFHGVYWPAFLIASGLQPPSNLLVHSHWTVNGEKMSKSQGNVVSPVQAAKTFTESGLRYFLLREGTNHSDSNYSEIKVMRLLNAELADTLGNLLNRCTGTTVNVQQYFPQFDVQYCQPDAKGLLLALDSLSDEVADHFKQFNFYKGVDVIISTLREANRFFEISQPWKLCKSPDSEHHLACVLHLTMETLRMSSIALQPIVPQIAKLLLDKLQIPHSERSWEFTKRQTNDKIRFLNSDKVMLFKKILNK
uniref:Methionine--tRNA ligase, mitochondrial n=1 Tax=Clastoptera arizonana TaxID=38151 RepID=A0A1B6E709_9HEMI